MKLKAYEKSPPKAHISSKTGFLQSYSYLHSLQKTTPYDIKKDLEMQSEKVRTEIKLLVAAETYNFDRVAHTTRST